MERSRSSNPLQIRERAGETQRGLARERERFARRDPSLIAAISSPCVRASRLRSLPLDFHAITRPRMQIWLRPEAIDRDSQNALASVSNAKSINGYDYTIKNDSV